MKKIKFGIINAAASLNDLDLKSEIENRGLRCDMISLDSIAFSITSKGFAVRVQGKSPGQIDIFIFRGYTEHFNVAKICMEELLHQGKTTIDASLVTTQARGKLFESNLLFRRGINVIETYQALSYAEWQPIIKKIKFPIIIKPAIGRKGRGVLKFDNPRIALAFLKKSSGRFIVQKYLKVDGDYRILVVGDRVLGGIKRYVASGDFRSNISVGGHAEKIYVNEAMAEIALRATRALDFEIAGVDIILHRQKYYVLEVNRSPEWQGFKNATGINPAEAIVDYALDKYKNNPLQSTHDT